MKPRPKSQAQDADIILAEWSRLSGAAKRPDAFPAERRRGAVRPIAEGALVLMLAVGIIGVLLTQYQQPPGPAGGTSEPPVSTGSSKPSPVAHSTASPEPPGATSPATRTPIFPSPSPTAAILAGEWRIMPTSPLQNGRSPTAAWTGIEFIVWGTAGLADGAAYDPATDNWRRLPDGPRGPAEYMAAFWTGDVVIAWHGGRQQAPDEPDGGIYDPATDSWSPISPSPLDSDYGQGVAWTGTELLILSPDMRAAAYDPTTNTWQELPPPPLPPGAVEADWTGSEWLVLGFGTDPDAAAEVAAFDPESGAWTQLAASPMTEQDLGRGGIWTGESWLFLGWESLAYDRAADQWRTVDVGACPISTDTAAWTGNLVLTRSSTFDPKTGACTELPPGPHDVLVSGDSVIAWTGMQLLVWGGTSGTGDTTTTDGAVFTPADWP